ncbi:reverse transcriptase domain-containing protein [Oceanisphaera sp.]|uniref:reverse transcriptase domain-containing protein n=1 Tax=Oceanisphaera sp. TaxID=1929979 RepID=UPI003A91FC2E
MCQDLDWYRRRGYAHFDRPLHKDQARRLVECPDNVASHAFWPVIINPQCVISRKKEKNTSRRIYTTKYRPIAYAAHSDSHIYAYYAKKLNLALEDSYKKYGGEHVLAYRRFDSPKNNIHFALDAFNEIKSRKECDVIAIDVEGFFDTLDHHLLKQAWEKLLGHEQLPADHYAVYKACTRDSAVTVPVLRDLFSGEIRRRAGKDGAAICTPVQFRSKVKHKLRPRHELAWEVKRKQPPAHLKRSPAGIPQGLPISAVLANLYMLKVDSLIQLHIKELGGSYRRYSDDILLVVPKGSGQKAERIVTQALQTVCLTVEPTKTMRCRYLEVAKALKCFNLDQNYNLTVLRPMAYLGFTFDGVNIRVRESTIAHFMIKAKRAIKRAKIAAIKNETIFIKKRQLYARLTRLGYGDAYGSNIYQKLGAGILPQGAPRLGFFKYLQRAEELTKSESIGKQIRQVESQVFREINRMKIKLTP